MSSNPTSNAAVPASVAVPAPSTVGNSFVKQYYHLLAESPDKLHRFYKDVSTFTRGSGSLPEVAISGQKNINEKIMSMNYAGARVDLESGSVDCQSSHDGGVLVMVSGIITHASKAPSAFIQTFFLAVQPNGYFVLNDAFRYLEPTMTSTSVSNTNNGSSRTTGTSVKVETVSAMTSPMHSSATSQPPLPSTPPASPKMRSPKKGSNNANVSSMRSPKGKAVTTPVSPPLPPSSIAAAPSNAVTPGSPAVQAATAAAAAPSGPKSWASLFAGKTAAEGKSAAANVATDSKPATKPSGNKKEENARNNSASVKDVKSNNNNVQQQQPSSRPPRGAAVLIIRDIPTATKEADLRAMFKEFGNITAVNVVAHRGHAFVDFDSVDSVKKALESKRDFKVGDKKVQVEEKYAARNSNMEGRGGGYNNGRGGGRGGGRGSMGNRGGRGGNNPSSFKSSNNSGPAKSSNSAQAGTNKSAVSSGKPVNKASRSD